ncbi:hypothetical protein [Rhizohabitans arisaemae]|uniref:hypothetical protein n=1 Tax=Rhizohabitans arisaemae TaxID=2720610 RepID=UPI0024B241F0|nr:hypothetical protein [Rhizohabitans arisaemae]
MRRGKNTLRAASALFSLLLLPLASPAQAAAGGTAYAPSEARSSTLVQSAEGLGSLTVKDPKPKKPKAGSKGKTPYTPNVFDRNRLPAVSGTPKTTVPPRARLLDRVPDGFPKPPPVKSGASPQGVTTGTVTGALEGVALEAAGRLRVKGWAADPAAPAQSIQVFVIAGTGTRYFSWANTHRPNPTVGDWHGFNFDVPVSQTRGVHQACVSAVYQTRYISLGCLEYDTRAFGVIEHRYPLVVVESGAYTVLSGWMIDPYTAAPARFDVFRDSQEVYRDLGALLPRPDIAARYPTFGPNHGWEVWIKHDGVEGVPHQLCVDATSGGVATRLGCETEVSLHDPFGGLDEVRWQGENVLIRGWAIDPDTRAPIDVDILADGKPVKSVTAGSQRDDIGAAHPQYGGLHGFETTIPAAFDDQTITVKPKNVGRVGPRDGKVEYKMKYDGSAAPCRCVGENFENGTLDKTAYWPGPNGKITSDPSQVVSGTYSVSAQWHPQHEWTQFLYTDKNKLKLKRSTTYTVTYRYRILGSENTSVENYFLARTDTGGLAKDVGWKMETEKAGSGVKMRSVTFTTGAFDDYYLIWGLHNGGAIAVDNIVVNGPVG